MNRRLAEKRKPEVTDIVATVGFSQNSPTVIDYPGRLTQVFQARLRIPYVAPPDPEFVGCEPSPQPLRDAVVQELEEDTPLSSKNHRAARGKRNRHRSLYSARTDRGDNPAGI